MGRLTPQKFKIVMIVAVVCIGLIIYSLGAGGPFFSDVLGTASAPLLSVGTGMTDGAKEFINLDGMTKQELKDLYVALSEENRVLREQLVDYYDLKEENASYERGNAGSGVDGGHCCRARSR